MRSKIQQLVENPKFQKTIIWLIVINAVILGMETSQTIMEQAGTWLRLADMLILKIFIIEILLKFYAYRVKFFYNPWNWFDSAIIAIALMPAGGAYSALRALRILRVLRLISTVPSMRRVIEGLLKAVPGIGSVATIMLLFFYIFSVIGTHLYGAAFPDWFGTLGKTMFTLFQIMTLESWSMGIVRPVMDEFPHAWVFFTLYILTTTFTMLNLFIAVIVNAMHSGADAEAEKSRDEIKDEILAEIRTLRTEVEALKHK